VSNLKLWYWVFEGVFLHWTINRISKITPKFIRFSKLGVQEYKDIKWGNTGLELQEVKIMFLSLFHKVKNCTSIKRPNLRQTKNTFLNVLSENCLTTLIYLPNLIVISVIPLTLRYCPTLVWADRSVVIQISNLGTLQFAHAYQESRLDSYCIALKRRASNVCTRLGLGFPFVPFFNVTSRCPGFISNVSFFKCSVTLIFINNRSVTDAILWNWHFYNDVNTLGG
jgi:hypothetical protein